MSKTSARPDSLVPKLRFAEFGGMGEWGKSELGKAVDFVSERISTEQLTLENYVSTENILPDYEGLTKASKLPSYGYSTRFKINDILISNIRPYLKKVWFSNKNGGASNDVIVIRAKKGLRAQYLSFLIKNDSFIHYVMRGAKGVKMPRGDISLMKEYLLTYPSDSEQQKIADCLSSIDQLITAEAKKLDALKAHKKGLMQQLFPMMDNHPAPAQNKPDGVVPRLRFPEFRDKGRWKEKKIGQASESVIAGGTPSTLEKEYWNGNIKWMNSGELNHKKVYDVQGRITKEGLQNSSTKLIPKKCVLIGLAGQGKTRGIVAMNMVELCINQSIAAIFPNKEIFDSHFLYQNLNSRYNEIRLLSTDSAGRGGLNLQIIKSLKIYLPLLPEQQKIADCLSSLDELISAQTRKLELLKAHKKGLMQGLFPNLDDRAFARRKVNE
jgi:type I restriction enzyme S subunit